MTHVARDRAARSARCSGVRRTRVHVVLRATPVRPAGRRATSRHAAVPPALRSDQRSMRARLSAGIVRPLQHADAVPAYRGACAGSRALLRCQSVRLQRVSRDVDCSLRHVCSRPRSAWLRPSRRTGSVVCAPETLADNALATAIVNLSRAPPRRRPATSLPRARPLRYRHCPPRRDHAAAEADVAVVEHEILARRRRPLRRDERRDVRPPSRCASMHAASGIR